MRKGSSSSCREAASRSGPLPPPSPARGGEEEASHASDSRRIQYATPIKIAKKTTARKATAKKSTAKATAGYVKAVKNWHAADPETKQPTDATGRPELAVYSLNTRDKIVMRAATDRGGFSTRELDRPYAAPLRTEDLTGLPPAWIGVGALDLFLEEDMDYAARLERAGVPCELHLVPGMYHGADAIFARRPSMVAFRRRLDDALRPAIGS